ncbi:MAG: SDR family NAD(P)-dependent oxidoreductase [Chloroflexaceae bacterium]|nr:SDR family NAD(P)-dependent oxidoreductase [Chloroflexaceae bacterium]
MQWAMPQASAPSALFHSDATYMITGGLGGIGLVLARWLIEQGARHLVLTGRRSLDKIASATTDEALEALRATGAHVDYYSLDVSHREQIEELISEIEEKLPPLRGIFHAAGVVNGSVLLQATDEQFQQVAAPKIAGSWNLHMLTQHIDLDYFVLFSSAATLLGSPGQGNYVAANAFLDALARYRQAQGLAALSINWGSWAEVGLAAAQANRGDRLAERGLTSFTPAEAMATLERLLQCDVAQVGVMPFDAQRWQQFYPGARIPYLSMLVQPADTETAAPSLREELLAVPAGRRRRTLLETYLREQVAQVLRYPAAQIAVDVPFATMGFDSLMAVEFANRVSTDSTLPMAATLIWTYPTVEALAVYLAERMGVSLDEEATAAQAASSSSTVQPSVVGEGLDDLLTRIAGLSDNEIGNLLERTTRL